MFQCKQGHWRERVGVIKGQDQLIPEEGSVPEYLMCREPNKKHMQSWDREMGRLETALKCSTEELGVSDLCIVG